MALHACDRPGNVSKMAACLLDNVLHAVRVIQHKRHRQVGAAQLIHLAGKLDSRQRVTAQLVEAGAAIAQFLRVSAQRQGGSLRAYAVTLID